MKKITKEHKDAMQAGRIANKAKAEEALAVVTGNSQLANPKFWAKVPAEIVEAIQKAMSAAADKAKQAEIDELEAKLAALRG